MCTLPTFPSTRRTAAWTTCPDCSTNSRPRYLLSRTCTRSLRPSLMSTPSRSQRQWSSRSRSVAPSGHRARAASADHRVTLAISALQDLLVLPEMRDPVARVGPSGRRARRVSRVQRGSVGLRGASGKEGRREPRDPKVRRGGRATLVSLALPGPRAPTVLAGKLAQMVRLGRRGRRARAGTSGFLRIDRPANEGGRRDLLFAVAEARAARACSLPVVPGGCCALSVGEFA
mmetsp:Transcript_27102/g.55197  ORF Transcript_27102/g.55197 Transcript_27102/m.55197 type:complete len:231 (-) Transcript_27102:157-849(-)